MRKLQALHLSCLVLLASINLAGCAATEKTETLTSAVEAFDKAINSAKSSLDAERKTRPRTRRYEAIEYHLQTRSLRPDEAAVIPDFLPSDPTTSFARYACAGQGALVREGNALSYASAYSAGIRDIMAPGKDTLAGQFGRFSALNNPIAAPKVPETKPGEKSKTQIENCVDEVKGVLGKWQPSPTTSPYDENPAAVIPLVIAAYQATEAFLKATLTTVNNYVAKDKFAKYVNELDVEFKKVMTTELSEDRLSASWSHRMAVSLHRPSLLFRQIFQVPANILPAQDDERIREIGLKVNDALAEFDALRSSPKPQDIRKGVLAAEQRLLKLANNSDMSLEEVASFLSALIAEFNDAKKKYEDADKAARTLVTTLRQ